MALSVGQIAPDFNLESHLGQKVRLSDFRGRCNVFLAFFPLAWTPVWTSQIPSYQAQLDRFDGVSTQVLGLSVDSSACLKAWAESLGGISYPLLSDFYPHGLVSQRYGVLRQEGYSERAIFVIDKQGVIRYVDVHDIDLQPDNEELFRVLAQIEPAQANWSSAATAASAPPKPGVSYTRPDADVVIYCTPWCPECRRVRAFLSEYGIHYAEVDISKNRAAAQLVRSYANGNETTPTLDIKGTIVVNFDRAQVAKLLGIHYP